MEWASRLGVRPVEGPSRLLAKMARRGPCGAGNHLIQASRCKIHRCWNHDLMDGQAVDVGKAFKLPDPGGWFDMMHVHHNPAAPVGQVIHCGCASLPWLKSWQA